MEGDDDNSDVSDYSDEDQCQPKEYDLMKETVLAKGNLLMPLFKAVLISRLNLVPDIGRLFSRLDENDDGVITLNELWRHSSLYQVIYILTHCHHHHQIDHIFINIFFLFYSLPITIVC